MNIYLMRSRLAVAIATAPAPYRLCPGDVVVQYTSYMYDTPERDDLISSAWSSQQLIHIRHPIFKASTSLLTHPRRKLASALSALTASS
jgi:hypothetical protein